MHAYMISLCCRCRCRRYRYAYACAYLLVKTMLTFLTFVAC